MHANTFIAITKLPSQNFTLAFQNIFNVKNIAIIIINSIKNCFTLNFI